MDLDLDGRLQALASRPSVIVVRRTVGEVRRDHVPLLAAGVAFWAFLALFPTLIAGVSLYGLVADPDQVERQVGRIAEALPPGADQLLTDQLSGIASTSGRSLGWSLVLSLLAALFTASGGVQHLVQAVNVAYDVEEARGFVRRRLLALGLVVGAVTFLVLAVGVLAVLPVLLRSSGLGGATLLVVQAARWGGLVVVVVLALGVVYRVAPAREVPQVRLLGLGSGVATGLWIVGSLGFSLYVSNVGSYARTYGALGGVAVLLLWLFLTAFIVLLGAELNAESERYAVEVRSEDQDERAA